MWINTKSPNVNDVMLKEWQDVSPRVNHANLVASYNRVTALVDEGRVTDVTYLVLCEAFVTVLYDIHTSKLESYRFDG